MYVVWDTMLTHVLALMLEAEEEEEEDDCERLLSAENYE